MMLDDHVLGRAPDSGMYAFMYHRRQSGLAESISGRVCDVAFFTQTFRRTRCLVNEGFPFFVCVFTLHRFA
jgi:hypothetical protein